MSVVAVAASSPVVGSFAPGPSLFGAVFRPAVLDASPDCHAGSHDYGTAEDVALTARVVCNDDDGDALSYAVATPPAHGAVSVNADGTFTYTPTLDYNGPDSFDFTASDGGSSDVGTATVDVTAVNDPPVANPDATSMPEDSGSVVTPNVLENDTRGGGPDEADQKLTLTAFTQPAHGKIVDNGDGTFTYTPNADFNGTDSFTYDVTDDGLTNGEPDPKTSTGTVTITVTPVNDAPVAVDDAYPAHKNIALIVNAANGVLKNDADVDGDTLTAALVSGPAHGTLTLNANGSFTYRPAAGFTGADSFTYEANDGQLDSDVASVSLTVTDDAPVANDDSYSTNRNHALAIAAPGVLANDTDANGDTLTATLVFGPSHGTLALNANGSFTYTPSPGYTGGDSFTYEANDGEEDSNVATVSLTVTNSKPVTTDDSFAVNQDSTLTVPAPGVLGNDTDADGDTLTATKLTNPSHGTVTMNPNGSLSYTPATGFVGADSFTYKASDGLLDSDPATVTINLAHVNHAPVANDNTYSSTEETALSVPPPGVLGNDTDPDGDALTAQLVGGPADGTLTLNSNGSFTYTPKKDFFGADSFTYRATDGSLNSEVVAVLINVANVEDAPVAVNDTYSVAEDGTLTVSAPGVVGNDTDADHEPLSTVLVAPPDVANATSFTLNANGSFALTPRADFNGTLTFTYKASDGTALSNAATVTITVTPVNDTPVAHNDGTYAVTGNTPLTVAAPGVLANDADVDGDPLTAKKATNPGHGSVTLNANGSFTYTPGHDYVGTDSFVYFANDGTVDSETPAIVTLNVSAAPTFALTVTRSGTGTGIVTSNPVGINCGADCTETFTKDTHVTLTAAPASNAAFAGWTGGCTGTTLTCVVTVNGVKNVTAVFAKRDWDLSLTKSGGGDGVVASVPSGIDCGPTCGSSYEDGAVVTLTATPNSSSEFDKWSGACSGSSNVCTLTISGTTNVVANFKAKKAPPPKVGETVVGAAVGGKVTYKLPGSSTFVPLKRPVQFPNATIVNAKDGVVSIASAEGNGTIDHARVWAGVFQIHTYVYKPLTLFGLEAKKKLYGTQFKLVERLDCTAAGLRTTRTRKLWASGKGRFRTRGRYSSATVRRGTRWYIEDRCDGTLTKVAKGIVEVQDFVRHKAALVKAGHQYFASAKAPKKAPKKKRR